MPELLNWTNFAGLDDLAFLPGADRLTTEADLDFGVDAPSFDKVPCLRNGLADGPGIAEPLVPDPGDAVFLGRLREVFPAGPSGSVRDWRHGRRP